MAMVSRVGAKRYLGIMKLLGVEISDIKSLTPIRNSKCGEIAKRVFTFGREISPIPPRVLVESTKSFEGFVEFLEVSSSRVISSDTKTELD